MRGEIKRRFRKSYLFALFMLVSAIAFPAIQARTLDKELFEQDASCSVQNLTAAIAHLAPHLETGWRDRLANRVIEASEEMLVPADNRIFNRPVCRPAFLLAQIWVESRFYPRARSRSNAQGLMQVKPTTAHLLVKGLGLPRKWSYYGVEENLRLGVKYMNDLFIQFTDIRDATLAYNIGPGDYRRGKMNLFYWERIERTYGIITQYGG